MKPWRVLKLIQTNKQTVGKKERRVITQEAKLSWALTPVTQASPANEPRRRLQITLIWQVEVAQWRSVFTCSGWFVVRDTAQTKTFVLKQGTVQLNEWVCGYSQRWISFVSIGEDIQSSVQKCPWISGVICSFLLKKKNMNEIWATKLRYSSYNWFVSEFPISNPS